MRLPPALTSSLLAVLLSSCATPTSHHTVVRVGVIGGMMRSGLWPELAKRFENERGYQTQLVLSGNRDLLADAFREGKLDVVAMHESDAASHLVSQGYGRNTRVWTRNEFVIIGPRSDPARIRGLDDGATALARIARAEAPFLDYQNSGPRDVAATLWQKARIRPQGKWLLETESNSSEEAIEFARRKQAYVVLGRIPALDAKHSPNDLEILVQGDPQMHRSFVVLEASPKRFPQANTKGAKALADFLLDSRTQKFLLAFATNTPPGIPVFQPVQR